MPYSLLLSPGHPRVLVGCRALGPALVAAALCVALVGCGSRESINAYSIPKPEALYAANHVDQAAASADRRVPAGEPTDRLLGAIVPHGAQTWYFKMTGPIAAVATVRDGFRQLIESVRFEEGDQAPPRWQLPESWAERPGSGMRLATLVVDVDGKSLEVSVMQIPSAPSASSLLNNVNRWRQQMQLAPITAQELPQQVTAVTLAGGGEATLVELLGRFQTGGMGNAVLSGGQDQPADEPAGDKPQ